jgi:hypothetical protein
MMKRFAASSAVVAAIAVLVAAVPAGAWTMSHTVAYQGSHGRATGRLCSASRFGNWHWQGTVRVASTGDRYTFRWTEPIFADAGIRHLRYTYVNSPAFSRYPSGVRAVIRAAVIRELNKRTVTYISDRGDQFLAYNHPVEQVTFRPRPGC